MQDKTLLVGRLWDGLSLPCLFFLPVTSKAKVSRGSKFATKYPISSEHTWGEILPLAVFTSDRMNLAALISASHEQAQWTTPYTSTLDTTQPCRNYTIHCSKYIFPELCESKTQLQDQGNRRGTELERREVRLSPGYVLRSGLWEATEVLATNTLHKMDVISLKT